MPDMQEEEDASDKIPAYRKSVLRTYSKMFGDLEEESPKPDG